MAPRHLEQVHKNALKPFARTMENMVEQALAVDDLPALLVACDRVSEVNCGWSTYQAAQFLRRWVRDEIARRKKAA